MARIKCEIQETTLEGEHRNSVRGIRAVCGRCGHETESYGRDEASVKRCLVLMREECPENECNFYIEE